MPPPAKRSPAPPPPPPEPIPATGGRSWVLLGGLSIAGLGLAALLAVLVLRGRSSEPSETPPVPPPTAAPSGTPRPNGHPPVGVPKGTPEEDQAARSLFEAAERIEKDQPDVALRKYLDLSVKFPFSSWARKAAERSADIEKRLRELFEKEFESARQAAAADVAAGKPQKAIDGLRTFATGTSKDILRRRALAEIEEVENRERTRYNEALLLVEELAKKHKYDEALAALKGASSGSIDEVAKAGEKDAAMLEDARRAWQEYQVRKAAEEAEAGLRAKAKGVIFKARSRRYDEAVKELETLAQDPKHAGFAKVLEGDRAIAAAAGEFWAAVVKGLKARQGHEVALQTADGKYARGKLVKALEDRAVLKEDGADVEVPLDRMHDDQLVLLAVGRGGLAEGAGDTYAKAAMWFFLEGKQEASRLYLATAGELGFAIEPLERAWRGGYFRATMAAK